MNTNIIGVCSNKPRPMLQNNHSKGGQYWKRDVWHIRASDTNTLCGRDSSEYLNMGEMKPDGDLCARCAKKAGIKGEQCSWCDNEATTSKGLCLSCSGKDMY